MIITPGAEQPARGLALGALRSWLVAHDEQLALDAAEAVSRLGVVAAYVAVMVWCQATVHHVNKHRTAPWPAGVVFAMFNGKLHPGDDRRLPERMRWAATLIACTSARDKNRFHQVFLHLRTVDPREHEQWITAVLQVAATTLSAPPGFLHSEAS